jgi:hypothetical protein
MRGVRFKYRKPSLERYFNDFNLMRRKIGNDLARGAKKRHDMHFIRLPPFSGIEKAPGGG